jgi:putative ribosome biogenesis GTPase RsgA
MSLSKLNGKTIVIIGPPGHGKSRTANTLIGSNRYPYGDARSRHTLKMQYETNEDGLSIIDLPGIR